MQQDDFEQAVLRLGQLEGQQRLTPRSIARALHLEDQEAERMLDRMVASARLELDSDDEGNLYYFIPGVGPSGEFTTGTVRPTLTLPAAARPGESLASGHPQADTGFTNPNAYGIPHPDNVQPGAMGAPQGVAPPPNYPPAGPYPQGYSQAGAYPQAAPYPPQSAWTPGAPPAPPPGSYPQQAAYPPGFSQAGPYPQYPPAGPYPQAGAYPQPGTYPQAGAYPPAAPYPQAGPVPGQYPYPASQQAMVPAQHYPYPQPPPHPAQRSPTAAALLGLIPGAGQLYNGQVGKGMAFFFLSAALVSTPFFLLPMVWGMMDAHATARRHNQKIYGLLGP